MTTNSIEGTTVAVIGLGYVGLPLAVNFGKVIETIGYDIKENSIASYRKNIDPNGEVTEAEFKAAGKIHFTSDPNDISKADFIVIAVPTPIDNAHQPDLTPLMKSSETAGRFMKQGAVVIFESTVYPGVTEDVCVPILEKFSGLVWQQNFHVGYSPERINPGDKEHTLTKIVKVVSGDTEQTLNKVAALYSLIIEAGVYRAASIKEAEAAKVIENTQRDLNIALLNEIAVIFDLLGIDTKNVLDAAGTKWNFLPFRPGLVGGHCIGVDPYYLTHKAESVGYHPEVILAGRRINDNMGKFVAEKTVKLMLQAGQNIHDTKIGVLGLTFKEDCPDLRNTKVVDIIKELQTYGANVLVHDPRASSEEAKHYYGITLSSWNELKELGAMILAVPHQYYKEKTTTDFTIKLAANGCLIDVKSILDPDKIKEAEINFWRL
jgi:UDP-N-acetyl-D-galactosamine dehydrogenase